MDECGLFREIPSKTLSQKSKKGYKKNKERLTIVFCTYADGTDKITLTIIGKHKTPRYFKNFETSDYYNYIRSA